MLKKLVTFAVLKEETLTEVRAVQLENMLLIFVAFAVLKFDKSSVVSFSQPENISAMLNLAPEVSKCETSSAVRDLQLRNAAKKLVDWDVSRDEMLSDTSFSHPSNMLETDVFFAVLKFERSSEVRFAHLENMAFMLVTFAVLKPETSSEVSDVQPRNMQPNALAFSVLKLETSSEVSDSQL